MGDANAHLYLWNINEANRDRRGEMIEEWMDESNMACLNNGNTTHINRSTGNGSAQDTTFAHVSLLDKLNWKVLNDFSCDHQPIIITYEGQIPKVNNTPQYKWRLDKARWEDFQGREEDSIKIREDKHQQTGKQT